MSLQPVGAPLVVDATDPQIVVGSVTIAIKLRNFGGATGYWLGVYQKDNSEPDWLKAQGIYAIDGMPTAAKIGTNPGGYFAYLLPALNAFLAKQFPAGAPVPTPTTDPFQALADYLTSDIKLQGSPPQAVPRVIYAPVTPPAPW
jgi:hypothetical protein